jgi:deoxyribodipyrimidine photo-lyase
VLRALIAETGAREVHWNRLYDPASRARDEAVKSALKADGVAARATPGHVLFEPWTVETGTGGFYRVYTPFWKAVRGRDPGERRCRCPKLAAPEAWPEIEELRAMGPRRRDEPGRRNRAPASVIGEEAARGRLGRLHRQRHRRPTREARDDLGRDGTSNLSENLTYGEISARTCWWAGMRAMEEGKAGPRPS